MPKLTMPGALLVGDAGGMVDTVALKGVHHCIKSGMLAAEAIYAALKRGAADFSSYEQAIEESSIGKELWQVRNTRQPFQKGFLARRPARQPDDRHEGQAPRRPLDWHRNDAQADVRRRHGEGAIRSPTASTRSTSSRRSSSPATRPATTRRTTSACRSTSRARSPRRGAGCARPGSTRSPTTRRRTGDVDVIVNYTNCVQCGAITAKGGRLTTPEGGDGPLYQMT